MHIVLMHFHLKTGGVTTVIKQQAALLAAAGHAVLIIVGEPPEDHISTPLEVVPALAYEERISTPQSADETAEAILKVMKHHWPDHPPDLIHAHNPTLAKNRQYQAVLKRLQSTGIKLLCQIHDFAEDGRPHLYFDEPYAADCHYAVVNGRDCKLLQLAGLSAQGVHYLPNAIVPIIKMGNSPADTEPSPVLYPVRAIRRKNIGEAILLRLFEDHKGPLAFTLPPNSPSDMAGYHSWRAFVKQHRLPVLFEAGLSQNFNQLMAHCRYVLTTSITEGFGFTFLESWTAGKSLWGRALPDICQDFTDQGLRLESMYTRIMIPLDWLDAEKLHLMWKTCVHAAGRQYRYPLIEDDIERGWRRISEGGLIDFGLLEETFQQTVIRELLADQTAFEQLIAENTFLKTPGPAQDNHSVIAHNQEVVKHSFSPKRYENRLLTIYEQALRHPVEQTIDKTVLLDRFLSPERFALLKWSAYDG